MSWRRLLSLGVVVFSLLCNLPLARAQLSGYQALQPDEKIDFQFTDAEGQPHRISDFKGKIVVLNFWAPWCPPCVMEMPSLNNLAETFPKEEVAVLTLCREKKHLQEAKEIFAHKNLKNLPLYFDEYEEGVRLLKVKGLPTTFILNRDGYLIGKLQGATEWDHYEVLDLIQAYIEGKTPEASSRFTRIWKWFTHIFK
jgi:thiol-disulfide isomerase/thioredoxin